MFYLNRKFREEVFLTNGMQIVHEEERNNWHLAGIWKRDKFISNFFIYWLYYYYIILFFFSFTKLLLNTFTANYELSRSPGFLYFCQLRDNSYYIIFNISFIYSKTNGFYYFCWKTKNTKNPYPGFSNIFKETFSVLPCYEISRSTEYGLIEISVINS